LLALSAASALSFLAVPGTAGAGADPSKADAAKPSSFAPHHPKSHVYGAPIQKPIVHKRKKRKPPAAPAPIEPIK
jgi:hypothetical protein